MVRRVLSWFLLVIGTSSTAAGQPQSFEIPARSFQKHSESGERLDGTLARLVSALRVTSAAAVAAEVPRSSGDRVPVSIRFKPKANHIADVLRSFGAVEANAAGDVVEAYVPVGQLAALARRDDIEVIQAILPPQPQAVTQGVTVHNAGTWQASGHTGAGVKVGIIDVGFAGLNSLRGIELPATIVGRCYTTIGGYTFDVTACDRGDVHGTAVAEAVVDMAPGVELFIANPYTTIELRNSVDWMISQGVRVINHSVSWTWGGPGDGTSPFSDSPLRSVEAAASAGVLWVNAAGNSALSSWTGPFVDANADSFMEFSGTNWANAVSLRAGRPFIAQARWDDSWTNAANDLDLYLVDASSTIVAWSASYQGGWDGSRPREILSFTPEQSGTYYLVVKRYLGAVPSWVQVQAFTGEPLQFAVSEFSTCNPAESASPSLLAVGAAPWSNEGVIEPFSSRGPTRDGRMKPDVVGVDRGDSATYGLNGFAGTSQAAPHVAGLAALVIETFPTTPAGNIAQYIRQIARSRGGPNQVWGRGLAQVPEFPDTQSLSALVASSSFPAPRGQPITFAAFAIGAQEPFEYKFWLYQPNIGWSVVQDYSTSSVLTWTPASEGTYALQVWARRMGSNAAYTVWDGTGYFTVGPPLPVRVTGLTANRYLPVWINTPIIWTASATGGVPPLQYQFWLYQENSGWAMVRDYRPETTYSWTPTVAGRYALQVWVRGADSTKTYEGWLGTGLFEIFGPPPVRVNGLSASVPSPSPAGVPITWTATATGGSTSLHYQFWRYKYGGIWTMVQDYSSNNTYTWLPGAGDVGKHALQVWVRQYGSTARYEAWQGLDFSVAQPPPVRVTGLTADVALPTLIGAPITWSATATGGIAPLEYRYWLFANGAWSVLQEYSPASAVTFTPPAVGDYAIQVWVRSSGSVSAYEDWRGSGYWSVQASAKSVILDLATDVSFPATVTRPITWRVRAGGGTPPLEYQFWRYRLGAGWSMVQDYGPANTYTWTPDIADSGTYAVQAWVRSAGSLERYEDWRGSGEFQVLPVDLLRLTSDPGEGVGRGLTQQYTSLDSTVTAGSSPSTARFSFITPQYAHWWYVHLAAPGTAPLVVGIYENARRFAFRGALPGLDVFGDGLGCNEVWGRFAVLEAEYAPDASLVRFAADFEQHCDGQAQALFGSVRYGSAVPLTPVQLLTPNESGTVRVGVPVSWTAPAGREYRIWRYRESTRTWVLVQDYASNPTYSWTPQAGDEGNWSVIFWERPVGSTAAYTAWWRSGLVSVSP